MGYSRKASMYPIACRGLQKGSHLCSFHGGHCVESYGVEEGIRFFVPEILRDFYGFSTTRMFVRYSIPEETKKCMVDY